MIEEKIMRNRVPGWGSDKCVLSVLRGSVGGVWMVRAVGTVRGGEKCVLSVLRGSVGACGWCVRWEPLGGENGV